MAAEIISGKKIADEMLAEMKAEIAELKARRGVVPGLAVVLVGEDPGSQVYVRNKVKTCAELAVNSLEFRQPADFPEAQLLALIDQLNQDKTVDGVLVQLPLPKHIDEQKVLLAIDPNKDVDGFHPVNVGKLMIGNADFLPCTPHGCVELLRRSGTETSGADVVVVGRSNIVGKPVAMMLVQKQSGANATVTIVHTRTRDLTAHTRRADILIVAAGVPEYIKGDQIKPGATVIDVGVNRIPNPDPTAEKKTRLVGDVHFASAKEIAAKITPVPGGVGLMTIAMLMQNTIRAAKLHHHLK
jgi:methylenetetrahydrofolate dehydrogenase (NADP+) / methenyltetrahydrofolate cyclohydrolase